MAEAFDVVVIGAGPAGYVAAIRAAQLGFRVACVDDWRTDAGTPALGGTCLNVGCIPSKALLESSELYALARDGLVRHGVHVDQVRLDLLAMMAHKDMLVRELTQGIAALFKSNGVEWRTGRGRLLVGREVGVTAHDGRETRLAAGHVILACGSRPVTLDVAPLAPGRVVDSTGALAFEVVPARLGIIGAGVIGLELGSVWRRLGAEAVLLEAQDKFLSAADSEVAQEALKQFRAQGLDIRLGARVLAAEPIGDGVTVRYQDTQGEHTERFDRLVVAVGRRANSEGLAAPEAGLLLDEWGQVHVDESCRTNLPGVYAIGDLVRGPMLAHRGMEEGVMVAESIAGRPGRVNYDAVPAVIYTQPEIAWVGATEERLKTAGTRYRRGAFPFAANGRAKAIGHAVGMVKVLADADTDRVRGVHIVGPGASELIAQAVLAMEFGASSEDLALTMTAHPTLSEAVHEAALAVDGRALHMARPRRPRA